MILTKKKEQPEINKTFLQRNTSNNLGIVQVL